jgi:predicted adenylyl cyclase CyaB
MAREYEYRFLLEDHEAIHNMRLQLKSLGATCIGKHVMRIAVYNPVNPTTDVYIRVRDEGTRITLTTKRDLDQEFQIENEVSMESNETNMIQMHQIMLAMGNTLRYRVDKRREIWVLDGLTEVAIDTYPGAPTYMEVESLNLTRLATAINQLGLKVEARIQARDIYNWFYGMTNRIVPVGAELMFDKYAKKQFEGSFSKNEDKFDAYLQEQLNRWF